MSRRFGRNQRRRLREEVARQTRMTEVAVVALEAERRDLRRERQNRLALERHVREWAERIVSLLGEDSAFAREVAEKRIDQGLFEAVTRGGYPYKAAVQRPLRIADLTADPMPLTVAQDVVEAFAIMAGYDLDTLRYQTRFAIRGKGGEYALMMDERTRQELTRRGDAELARYLLARLVAPWMQGPEGPRDANRPCRPPDRYDPAQDGPGLRWGARA